MHKKIELTNHSYYAMKILKIAVWLLLLPLLPFTVALNIGGMADKLSILPRIERGGGFISGLSALVIVGLVLGIFAGGAMAAFGADIPLIGDDDNSTATPKETPEFSPTPIKTPTTPTPNPSVQPTLTATRTPPQYSDLKRFELIYRDYLQKSVQNETLTDVPVISMQYRETDDKTTELWIVYWKCDDGSSVVHQRFNIVSGYMYTVGHSEGNKPDQLQMYGVNNLESYNDSIGYIPTSSTEEAFNGSMDRGEFLEDLAKRMRAPTESESEIAFQMAVNESGREKAEKAFHEHYPLEESDGGCPGGAEGVDD